MNDKKLHETFVQIGRERNKLTYRLLALLPEIFNKKIYKKQGYETIYEYAGKLAGLSKSVVEKTLRVEKHIIDKPALKQAVVKVGIHKVALVAGLATPQNEAQWADKVENMSKSALSELSKEMRSKQNPIPGDEFGPCAAAPQKLNIELDEDMQFLFLKLKKKLGKNLSNKSALKQMLSKLATAEFPDKKNNIPDKKASISANEKMPTMNKNSIPGDEIIHGPIPAKVPLKKITRYIIAAKKQSTIKKTNGKCVYPNCNRPADIIHHRERFSTNKNHESIIPTCKIHHEFAHNGLIHNEKSAPQKWKLGFGPLQPADIYYRKYRRKAVGLSA